MFIQKQFIKLMGVSPEALARIHRAVEEHGKLPEDVNDLNIKPWINKGGAVSSAVNRTVLEILRSKFDKEYDSYTVELEMVLAQKVTYSVDQQRTPEPSTHTLYTPMSVVEALYKALDEQMLPSDTELLVHPPIEKPQSIVDEELEEKILPLFEAYLGEKLTFDVIESRSGEIIIPAERKITKTLLRKMVRAIQHIDLQVITDPRLKELIQTAQRYER